MQRFVFLHPTTIHPIPISVTSLHLASHSFRRFPGCATATAPSSLSSVAFDRSNSTSPPHLAPTLKSPLPLNLRDIDGFNRRSVTAYAPATTSSALSPTRGHSDRSTSLTLRYRAASAGRCSARSGRSTRWCLTSPSSSSSQTHQVPATIQIRNPPPMKARSVEGSSCTAPIGGSSSMFVDAPPASGEDNDVRLTPSHWEAIDEGIVWEGIGYEGELNKIKKQVDNVEATKAKALSELKSAKDILQNLTTKLANVSQCKQSTMAAAKVVRNTSRRFEKTKEYDPELTQSLDTKLAETTAEIEILQQQIKNCMLPRWMLKYLKLVNKEQGEVKEKKHAAEALAANLTSAKIQKLELETEGAKREAEEMKRKAQELKQEAERARPVAEEAENKLELVLVEAKDAKAAGQRVVKEITILSQVGRVPNSKFSGMINKLNEDFEAMKAKAKECEDLVEKKEAIVMAELQQIYA
ncbi:hypothetical protein Fmac_032102 [Flemingia macrophylla]|uniref:Uncharacterized protein n=1 Tax=Flemingia macrophylla TaxID=520843 RepID=A0ABD1L408_9FABA